MESARLLRDLTEKLKLETGGMALRSTESVKDSLHSAGAQSVRNGMERTRETWGGGQRGILASLTSFHKKFGSFRQLKNFQWLPTAYRMRSQLVSLAFIGLP